MDSFNYFLLPFDKILVLKELFCTEFIISTTHVVAPRQVVKVPGHHIPRDCPGCLGAPRHVDCRGAPGNAGHHGQLTL